MGGLFIFVVLYMRDGIVGTIGKWLSARKKHVPVGELIEEADALAADRQKDFRPGGSSKDPTET